MAVNLRKLTNAERDTLYTEVAIRVANRATKPAICQEFDLSEPQFRNMVASQPFTRALSRLKETKLAIHENKELLTQNEMHAEAREAFGTVKRIRAANDPDVTDDIKSHALALQAAKFILEAAGLGKIDKSVHLDAKANLTPEQATLLLDILKTPYPTETLIDISPEDVRTTEYADLINPQLTTAMDVSDQMEPIPVVTSDEKEENA